MAQAPVGTSLSIYNGDVLALSTYSGVSVSSVPAIRDLLAADKTALYGGVSVLTAPGALTVTAVTATSYGVPFLANGTYYALATWVSATGETTAGTATGNGTTSGGTQALLLTPPASPPAGAIGWKAYVSAVGTTTPFFLQSGVLSVDDGFAVGGYGTSNALVVTGANPPTVNTSGKIAGVAGVAAYGGATSASGVFNAAATGTQYGGITYQLASMGQGIPIDSGGTNQSLIQYYAADRTNIFRGYLNSATASYTLNGTQGGLILTGTNPTSWTLDTSPAAGAAIITFGEPDAEDPLYNQAKGAMFFQFNATYNQLNNGVVYTAQ